MNVRFAPGEVRFRIDRDELATLVAGQALSMRVALPGQHTFSATVTRDRLRAWRLDTDPTGLWLAIPKEEIEALAEGAPTAEGLMHPFELGNGSPLYVRFEVDVRS